MDICEKARDRIDKLVEQEKYLIGCFRHLICPRCGGDVEKKYTHELEDHLRYTYKCIECDWKSERNS